MVTTPTVVSVLHVDIEVKIVQWLAGSFCIGDVEVAPSFLSEVPPATDKAVALLGASQ